ncbi:MAG: elongation factor P, partial [Anaerolineae bacterium]|nr:elongation factor P [Anaerolineae bacterium]
GTIREMTFNSGEKVEDIRIETTRVEYLYEDGDFLTFMDLDTYEQPPMLKDLFGDDFSYLTPNLTIKLMSYEGEIIDYELPPNVDHKIVEAEMAVAGNTATGATKRVRTETGLMVSVPLFVEEGNTIRVDTRNGEYITRV